MLNLLHDISKTASRITELRTRINELTEELHKAETLIAVDAVRCELIRSHELEIERMKNGN